MNNKTRNNGNNLEDLDSNKKRIQTLDDLQKHLPRLKDWITLSARSQKILDYFNEINKFLDKQQWQNDPVAFLYSLYLNEDNSLNQIMWYTWFYAGPEAFILLCSETLGWEKRTPIIKKQSGVSVEKTKSVNSDTVEHISNVLLRLQRKNIFRNWGKVPRAVDSKNIEKIEWVANKIKAILDQQNIIKKTDFDEKVIWLREKYWSVELAEALDDIMSELEWWSFSVKEQSLKKLTYENRQPLRTIWSEDWYELFLNQIELGGTLTELFYKSAKILAEWTSENSSFMRNFLTKKSEFIGMRSFSVKIWKVFWCSSNIYEILLELWVDEATINKMKKRDKTQRKWNESRTTKPDADKEENTEAKKTVSPAVLWVYKANLLKLWFTDKKITLLKKFYPWINEVDIHKASQEEKNKDDLKKFLDSQVNYIWAFSSSFPSLADSFISLK